jgi:integrase
MLTANVTVKHAEKLQQQVEQLVSYTTSFQVINKLSVVWNRGIKLGLARSNPFAEMGLSKPPPRRQKWTDEQFADFIAHCDKVGGSGLVNPKDSWSTVGTHVILCMHLAQRAGDMRTLTWSNLNDSGLLTFTQKKTGKVMVMPITQLIEARLRLHPHAAHTDNILRNPNTNEPYTADNLRRRFRTLAREMGLPDDIQVMDARRTAATNAANAGATEAEIMALTGHTRPETLREIYQLRTVKQLNNLNSKRGL